jgi:signal transduction histidine kinase
MLTHPNINIDQIDYQEGSKKYIHNAIESVLSLGDFQKEVNSDCTPYTINSMVNMRIQRLINFEASAIYLVDDETSDMKLSVVTPDEAKENIEEELEFMIENGFVSWALRERRGITVLSKDRNQHIFLHVMATYSRIRGLFMGIFPPKSKRLPDASLEIVSLILRNAVNGIESLMHSTMWQEKKKSLEKALKEKTKQLIRFEKDLMQAQKSEAIAALAGGVAHQFNNALTGLIGNIDLIAMTAQESPDILSYIDRTHPIIEKMSNLTSQLLAYAQGGAYMTQTISMEVLFNELLPAIKHILGKQIQMTVDMADASRSMVKVDLIQMRMVILAIVNNAKEAIANNGWITISIHLVEWEQMPDQISSELKPDNYVCISIEDSGIGMDEETLRRVFEPFFSTKFTGRGLSMAAVLGIIKRHHGWVAVRSVMGRGSKVQIYLPRTYLQET